VLTFIFAFFSLVTIDVDENNEIAAKYQVGGVSSMIFACRLIIPTAFVDPSHANRDSIQGRQGGEPVQ
jgi:hypothetical protein